jgi:hypothetical protein
VDGVAGAGAGYRQWVVAILLLFPGGAGWLVALCVEALMARKAGRGVKVEFLLLAGIVVWLWAMVALDTVMP